MRVEVRLAGDHLATKHAMIPSEAQY